MRRAAFEALFRVRGVESPPSPRQVRQVFHRPSREVSLVSELDAEGRVVRHELTFHGETVTWDETSGFQATGALEPVKAALAGYRGPDRVLQHLSERARPPGLRPRPRRPEPQAAPPSRRWPLVVGVGLMVIAVGLALLALR